MIMIRELSFAAALVLCGAIPALAESQPTPPAPASAIEAGPSAQHAPAARKPVAAPRHEAYVSDDPVPSLDAATASRTALAVERYQVIVEAGGWPGVPAGLTPASKGAGVATLRRRLAIEGYLPVEASTSEEWGPDIDAALRAFQ